MARFNQPTLLSLLGLFLGLLSQSNAAPAPRVARDVDVESESYQRHRPPGFHHGYPPFPPTLKVREESAEGSVDNADAPSGWFYKHSLDDSVSEDKIDSTDAENGRKAVFLNYREPLERRGWFYEHSLDDSAEEQKTDSTDVEDGGPRPIADYATYRLDPPSPRALAARSDDEASDDEYHRHRHHHHHPPTLAARSEDQIEEDEHHHHDPPPPHHPPTLAARSEDEIEGDEHHRHHHHHHPPTLAVRSEDDIEDENHHHHHHHHPPPPHHPPTLAVRSEDEIEGDEHHRHHHHHHPPTLAVRSEEEVSTDYPKDPGPGWRPVPIEFPSGPGNLEARNDKEDLKWPPPPPPGIGYPPKDKAVAGASDGQEINARGEDDAQDPEFYIPPNCHEYGCPP
ncbi:hypothetical protein Plec18170_004344 [Paecilomyces lecythidis]